MKIIFQVFSFIVFSFAAAQMAYSCSCFKLDNKDEVRITDIIFTGKVVKITQDLTYVPPKTESVAPQKES